MPGALLSPAPSIGLPASPLIDLAGLELAVAGFPGLRFDFDPQPSWYGQHGPAGHGLYSRAARDGRIDAMIPTKATQAPALTNNLIGSRYGLQYDGVDDVLIPYNGTIATITPENANLDEMDINLTEWSFITVVKTTLNVSSYIVGPRFKPAGVLTSGAGGGECLSILLSPLSGGALQYPRLLYGNNTARLGSNSFTFAGAASIVYTFHPGRGLTQSINNVEVATAPADVAPLATGRWQMGRRANTTSNIASHKQGRMIILDKAIDLAGPYADQRNAMMALLHKRYEPDLLAL